MRKAFVIGSGPNGLAAAIQLARNGVEVEVLEADCQPGGGASTAELTLPGFLHDRGSAIHPLAVASPFFQDIPLRDHGLEWIFPPAPLAHPLDDGRAVVVERDLQTTAQSLGPDASAYEKLYAPLLRSWKGLLQDVLSPQPAIPRHPFLMASFGLRALQPATLVAKTLFRTEAARAAFAGMAAHSFLPLEQPMSASFGMILGGSAHAVGWPMPKGGSQSLTNALVSYLQSLGGTLRLETRVTSLSDLPAADLILCDITPDQLLQLAAKQLPSGYASALRRYRHGPGVFKMDWALRAPIPWAAPGCLRAGTIHLGGTLDELSASERAAWSTTPSPRPFVLLAQQSLFDPTRAPSGQHSAWAYCHVPFGSTESRQEVIEAQIERFAPGFRDTILARATFNTAEMQAWNPNLVGGDINGGALDAVQFVRRPTWRQYSTPLPGVFLCSSSTPPGGGVHGMCGYHAARRALTYLGIPQC